MKSICDLPIWEKDALMAWVFDMQEKIFDMKTTMIDPFGKGELMNGVTGETRRESYNAVKQNAAARKCVILEILTDHGGARAKNKPLPWKVIMPIAGLIIGTLIAFIQHI
jgi:hypothetical protein